MNICSHTCDEIKSVAEVSVEVVGLPDDTKIPEKTGIKPDMKTAAPLIAEETALKNTNAGVIIATATTHIPEMSVMLILLISGSIAFTVPIRTQAPNMLINTAKGVFMPSLKKYINKVVVLPERQLKFIWISKLELTMFIFKMDMAEV